MILIWAVWQSVSQWVSAVVGVMNEAEYDDVYMDGPR